MPQSRAPVPIASPGVIPYTRWPNRKIGVRRWSLGNPIVYGLFAQSLGRKTAIATSFAVCRSHTPLVPLPSGGREFKKSTEGNQRETHSETQKSGVSPSRHHGQRPVWRIWSGNARLGTDFDLPPCVGQTGCSRMGSNTPTSNYAAGRRRVGGQGLLTGRVEGQGVGVSAAGAPAAGTPDEAEAR